MKHYDHIIIGTGGGTKLGIPTTKLGFKVAILEKDAPGGTCLNRGCIPSKMLIHPADLICTIQEATKFEIGLEASFGPNFAEMVTRVSATVDKDSQSIPPLYNKNPNIDFYPYEGKFVDDKTIEVNGEKITANKIFIATGARPSLPDVEGLSDTPYMTSTEALRNKTIPKRLLIIGGGYIAVELGHVYQAMGSETHFVIRSQMIKHEDQDVIAEFTKEFSKRHNLHFGLTPESVKYENDLFLLTCVNQSREKITLSGEALLVASGVIPNSDNLGLENTSIKTKKGGFIQVNSRLETSVPDVYAFGDVVGNYMFRHSANFEGEYLFRTIYEEKQPRETRTPINYGAVPHAIFTYPQVAGVGKTEQELLAIGQEYVTGVCNYKNSAMGMARLSDNGFVKVLVDKNSRKLLGAHIIGEEASNMIHLFIALIHKQSTIDDMLEMIYIHPALPEIARNAGRKAFAELAKLRQLN
jgi:mycothione reductase